MANSSTDTALFADDATEPSYRNTNYVAYATTAYKVSVTIDATPSLQQDCVLEQMQSHLESHTAFNQTQRDTTHGSAQDCVKSVNCLQRLLLSG